MKSTSKKIRSYFSNFYDGYAGLEFTTECPSKKK
jgi:hypothetical protein